MDFQRLLRKAEKTAVKVTKKGGELVSNGKTKLAVKKEEYYMDDLFYQIGKKVYDKYESTGEVLCDCLLSELEEISAIKAKIAEMECESHEEDASDCDCDINIEAEEENAEEVKDCAE